MLTEQIRKTFMRNKNGTVRRVGEVKYKDGILATLFNNILNVYILLYIIILSYQLVTWMKQGEIPIDYISLVGMIFASLSYGAHAYQHSDPVQFRNSCISVLIIISLILLKYFRKKK